MKWDELTEDEVTDWRKSPVTDAFAEQLTALRDSWRRELESSALRDDASRHEISRIAGRLEGMASAMKLLLEDA